MKKWLSFIRLYQRYFVKYTNDFFLKNTCQDICTYTQKFDYDSDYKFSGEPYTHKIVFQKFFCICPVNCTLQHDDEILSFAFRKNLNSFNNLLATKLKTNNFYWTFPIETNWWFCIGFSVIRFFQKGLTIVIWLFRSYRFFPLIKYYMMTMMMMSQ